jgi:hypothetical protein
MNYNNTGLIEHQNVQANLRSYRSRAFEGQMRLEQNCLGIGVANDRESPDLREIKRESSFQGPPGTIGEVFFREGALS